MLSPVRSTADSPRARSNSTQLRNISGQEMIIQGVSVTASRRTPLVAGAQPSSARRSTAAGSVSPFDSLPTPTPSYGGARPPSRSTVQPAAARGSDTRSHRRSRSAGGGLSGSTPGAGFSGSTPGAGGQSGTTGPMPGEGESYLTAQPSISHMSGAPGLDRTGALSHMYPKGNSHTFTQQATCTPGGRRCAWSLLHADRARIASVQRFEHLEPRNPRNTNPSRGLNAGFMLALATAAESSPQRAPISAFVKQWLTDIVPVHPGSNAGYAASRVGPRSGGTGPVASRWSHRRQAGSPVQGYSRSQPSSHAPHPAGYSGGMTPVSYTHLTLPTTPYV